jgi:hypothetical protein
MWSSKRLFEGFFNYQDADASEVATTSTASEFGTVGSATATATASAPAPADPTTSMFETMDSDYGVAPAPAPADPATSMFETMDSDYGVAGSAAPAQAQAPAPGPAPGPAPVSEGFLTLLINLVSRIDDERMKLYNLNSEDPTVLAKINQLALLRDELMDYVDNLRRGLITVQEIPLSVENANAFLQHLNTHQPGQGQYPALFRTANTNASAAPAPATSLGSLGGFDFKSLEGTQDMFKYLQDIKWRFELNYDPSLSQKTDLLNRLESLEKRIMDYAKEGVVMPDAVKQVLSRELDLLTKIIQNTKQTESVEYQPRQNSQHTRMTPSPSYRSDERTYSNPSRSYNLFDGVPRDSPDIRIRPGFVLTDEQIRRRGSAAAFNTQVVGGPDYKKRSEDLCRQIRGANIGTPADFGCIENPAEVSANYSWKGNYSMVCNRLGDTWGSWYPAMFGCPATTPGDRYNGNLL